MAVMAVIKANGYGHGAVQIAPTLLAHGARYLAVARLEEALALREAYPDAPLFVLGYTPDRLLETAVANHIVLTICQGLFRCICKSHHTLCCVNRILGRTKCLPIYNDFVSVRSTADILCV